MKPINFYRYELIDRFGTIDTSPMGEADFKIKYGQEDDGKYFYSKEFQGKLKFSGAIFKRLQKIEKSIYICSSQRLKIYRKCSDDAEQLIFDGYFKLTDGNWDEDNCVVELKFQKNVLDKCLQDNKNKKINLLSEISNSITVKTSTPNGVIEYKSCFQNSPSGVSNDYWCGTGDPYAQNWTLISYNENSPDGVHYHVTNKWAREIVELDCGITPPSTFVLVEDNCANTGKKKYAKKITTYGCVYDYTPIDENGAYSASMDCQILGYQTNNAQIDNGRHLKDVLEKFVSTFCGGFTVVSDFFQINPQNPSAINYVTGEVTQVANLILFQKSDVKRPTAYNNATKAEWTFEKLMETLNFMFNVSYAIVGNTFRLEHISWFSRNQGLDLTLPRYAKFVNKMRRYSYDVGDIPEKEIFKFKEQRTGGMFDGEITYNGSCAIGVKNSTKNYTIDELMTDVQYCLNNPDPDSKYVEDAGFVMIATQKVGTEYYIITEADDPDNVSINNTLVWEKLITRYQSYNRPLISGKLNNVDITFNSAKPIKSGEKITVPLCCGDVFDPNDEIITPLGNGIIKDATFNLQSGTIDLNLIYDVFNSLTNNAAPVIVANAIMQTYQNTPLNFAINATDADGTVQEINVINAYNGTVVINSLNSGTFTPANNFVGYTYFYLQAVDNWSEVSNVAGYIVEVLPANQPPVAVNDEYNVYHGETFYAYLGIFNNDADDNGFTILNPNLVTAQGIGITIDANGRFNYVPPANFEGDDSFNYTIKDNQNLQSSATVTLHVAFKNKPIAVNDTYQTQKNVQLITDGTAGKAALFANDYTPDGLTYSYTTNVENKATSAGGTVQIQANGLFTYNPPANFTGQDTFSYTVNNVNGSDTGTVTINVLPTIYVRLIKTSAGTQGHIGDPYYARLADYRLYFYSNAAGTVPLNVTGFGFKVNIKEHYEINDNGNYFTYDSIWETSELSGTSYLILDDFVWQEQTDDGNGNFHDETITVTLSAGTYVII